MGPRDDRRSGEGRKSLYRRGFSREGGNCLAVSLGFRTRFSNTRFFFGVHPVPLYIYVYVYIICPSFFYFVALHIPCLSPSSHLSLYLLPPFIPAPASVFSLVVDDDGDDDDSCSLSLNLLALSSTLFTVHIYLCYIIRRVCSEQIPREHSTRSLRMFFS